MNFRANKISLIQFSFLLGSLFLVFIAIQPLRNAADRRASILKKQLIEQMEDTLGITIQYESISPALLSIVTIRGLIVIFDQGEFSAGNVRVYYNPLRNLTGGADDPVKMISKIAVFDSHLDLHLESTASDDGNAKESTSDPWQFLVNKSVDISGFSARISLDDSLVLTAEDVSLLMKDDQGTVRYSFNGDIDVEGSGNIEKFGTIKTSISSQGLFSLSSSTANGRLDLLAATSSFVHLEPVAIDFTYAHNQLTARRLDDSKPLDLAFRYSGTGWNFSGEAVGLRLREIVEPGETVSSWDPWFSSVIEGDFVVSSGTASGKFNYDINLDLSLEEGILPWDAKAELKIKGSETQALIDMIRLSAGWGDLEYSGSFQIPNFAPDGQLTLNYKENKLGYPVSAMFDLNSRNGIITAEPLVVEAAGLEFEDFRFFIIRELKTYTISLLAVPEKKGNDTVRAFAFDGLFDFSGPPVFRGFVSIDGIESSYLAQLAGLDRIEDLALLRDSLFTMEGYLDVDSTSWFFSVTDLQIRDKNNSSNIISLQGRVSPGSISVDRMRIAWNEYVVDARGYGKSTSNGGIIEGRILVKDQLYPFNATWDSNGTIQIHSNIGLSALVGQYSVSGRPLNLVARDIPLPLKNGNLVADINIQGHIARDGWEVSIHKMQFTLTDRPDQPDITVMLNGNARQGHLTFSTISILDGFENLSGNAFFESSGDKNILRGRLMLKTEGKELYELSFLKDHDNWDIGIDIQAARLDRIWRNRAEGELFLNSRMTGTIDEPLLDLDIRTIGGILDGHPVEVGARMNMKSGHIRIQDISCQYKDVSLSRGLLLINLGNGTVRSTAEINGMFNQVPVSSGVSLAVDFGRRLSLMEFAGLPNTDFKGTLATRAVLWDSRQHLPPLTFQFSRNDESFHVQTPDAKILNISYVFDSGALNVILNNPLPVMARGGGTVKEGNLNLSFPELKINPILMNYTMYRDPILLQYHVVFQSGHFAGNLDITGPSKNPSIDGTIRAEKIQIDTPYTYAVIQPASTILHFRDHRIDIDTLEVPVGEGILYGGGYFELDHLKIVDFDMVYGGKKTTRGEGVPVYYPLMGINMDGVFTGEVRMTGGNQQFALAGDITFPFLKASLGSVTIPVSQKKEGGYPVSVNLDLNFITGKNCSFYLPNEQLKIVQATAESGRVINLKYSNNPQFLSIKGRLPVKSGDIYYFDRDFQITEGSILFNESFVDFNPRLSLRAEKKVRDNKGEDVSVALVYNALVKSDFAPIIETIPKRSDLEVMALFGQAVALYSQSSDTNAASAVLLATGGMFGQIGIVQPFEDVLKKGLNLDMVTIRTDIIENTIAKGLSGIGSAGNGILSEGLGRYLDNTSLYAGKYIGDALFVSGTISANYFEGWQRRSIVGGLEFETAVSLEMETPFFNVAWSYSPDALENQNFVANNEISLKWKFSY